VDSLTGDPELDALVPAAVRLTCGLREWDPQEVAAAFDDAAAATSPGNDPATALAIVCAAMVPWNQPPSDLLAWVTRRVEFERLRGIGVDAATAADLTAAPEGR
jgi:hypothetical protein